MYTETHKPGPQFPFVYPDVEETEMHSTQVYLEDESSGSSVSSVVVLYDEGDGSSGDVLVKLHIGESQQNEVLFIVTGYYAIVDILVDYGSKSGGNPPLTVSMYLPVDGTCVSFDPDILGTSCDVIALLHLQYAGVSPLDEDHIRFGVSFTGSLDDVEYFGANVMNNKI